MQGVKMYDRKDSQIIETEFLTILLSGIFYAKRC